MKGPTAEEIRELREQTGEGLMECKRILTEKYNAAEKKEILKLVTSLYYMDKKDAEYDETLREILLYLVRKA